MDVAGEIVLQRLAHPPAHALARTAAIARARSYATKRHFPAAALEAAVTVPGNEHLQRAAAWVVTFTSPKPTDVGTTSTVLVRHYSVAIDVTTGRLLVGFFTK